MTQRWSSGQHFDNCAAETPLEKKMVTHFKVTIWLWNALTNVTVTNYWRATKAASTPHLTPTFKYLALMLKQYKFKLIHGVSGQAWPNAQRSGFNLWPKGPWPLGTRSRTRIAIEKTNKQTSKQTELCMRKIKGKKNCQLDTFPSWCPRGQSNEYRLVYEIWCHMRSSGPAYVSAHVF